MNLRKFFCFLAALFLAGGGFYFTMESARSFIIAANLPGYRPAVLELNDPKISEGSALFGEIDGNKVFVQVPKAEYARIISSRFTRMDVWYNPSLPNLSFNGQDVVVLFAQEHRSVGKWVLFGLADVALTVILVASAGACLKRLPKFAEQEEAGQLQPA